MNAITTVEIASATRDALLALAGVEGCPRPIRYEMKRRAREWAHVAALLDADTDGEAVIELVGAVVPGMEVLMSTGWWPVVRKMERDGQVTLHLEDEDGIPRYLNHYCATSPVVVRA